MDKSNAGPAAFTRAIWFPPIMAAIFFGYTLSFYLAAAQPPPAGTKTRDSSIAPPKTERVKPDPNRYQSLAKSRIFGGSMPPPPIPSPPAEALESAPPSPAPHIYSSALMLRGIAYSPTGVSVALLARAGSKPESDTWPAKAGETILGETVRKIENDRVVLERNGAMAVLTIP